MVPTFSELFQLETKPEYFVTALKYSKATNNYSTSLPDNARDILPKMATPFPTEISVKFPS
jgi:hypothetical protein